MKTKKDQNDEKNKFRELTNDELKEITGGYSVDFDNETVVYVNTDTEQVIVKKVNTNEVLTFKNYSDFLNWYGKY